MLAALAHRLIHGRAPSLAESMLGIFARGYWPLFWRGTWPKGYAVAYCPPEFPQATNIPADCIPTQQQIDEGGGIPWIKGQRKAKPPKPPAIPMPPVIAVVPNTAWKEFTGPAFNAERIVAHLAAMFPGQPAGTGATLADIPEPSRRYLVELGQRLTGAVVVREPCDDSNPPEAVLRLLFLPQDGKASREPIRLDCRGPYIGGLKGLPASIGQVLRIHNGMALHGGFGDPAWHVYDGKQFVMEWDVWHQANPDDPEDPFPTPPQVPLTDGQDIYLLHPRHRRPDGEPTLHAMSHESGRLDDRDLGSAIARFFSLVHLVVVGRDENTGQ
ncbi:hypothetical protein LBMAG53_28960 [Planctomycetota bacterium]|nr:hypothetical protein LBMAG53_28960 [Planctomycetota bacterium]